MKKSKQRKMQRKRRAERQRRRRNPVSQAYHGKKYRTEQLAPFFFETEVGIHEAFVISKRKITDHDVRGALERLIDRVRSANERFSPRWAAEEMETGNDENTRIAFMIRRHWMEYDYEFPFPGSGSAVGVLRTILGSIETWGNMNPASRGYLRYLEDFLADMGVHCRPASKEEARQLFSDDEDLAEEVGFDPFEVYDDDSDEEDEKDELLATGRAWIEGEQSAGIVFHSLAQEMIESGQGRQVAETCRQLLADDPPDGVREELIKLSDGDRQRLSPPPSRLKRLFRRLIGGKVAAD